MHTYYLVFTSAKIEHTEAYLWLNFLEFKTEEFRSNALSDEPLWVLDNNSNKAVFQFWVSYVLLYKKQGTQWQLFYKSINLKKDTQITLSAYAEARRRHFPGLLRKW